MDEIKKKRDNIYIVMIFHALHSDFDHLRDQMLTSHDVSFEFQCLKARKFMDEILEEDVEVRGELIARTVK